MCFVMKWLQAATDSTRQQGLIGLEEPLLQKFFLILAKKMIIASFLIVSSLKNSKQP